MRFKYYLRGIGLGILFAVLIMIISIHNHKYDILSDDEIIEKAKELLEEAGYNVKKTGKTSSIAQTIITNKKDVTDENLKNIKQVLGKGNISINKSSTSLVDVTIIIGKDF